MRDLSDSERAVMETPLREYWVSRDGLLPKETRAFEAGFIIGLDHSAARLAGLQAERDGLTKQVKDLEELRDYLSDKLQEARQFQANQRNVNKLLSRQLKRAKAALADEARRALEPPTT